MKVIIFDGSFKTTAFIRRLILGLIKAGNDVFVLGFNEQNPHPIDGVSYIKLGSNQSKLSFIKTALKFAFGSKRFLFDFKQLLTGSKKDIQGSNLKKTLNNINPDVVHLQWVSNIPLFEVFLEEQDFNFILSQRGFQTNVRPFVNSGNFEYLQQWLPKFQGFHSVSEAISREGDKIYNELNKIDDVVYTGLDFSKFEFELPRSLDKELRIISVGRTHWKKGYNLSIRALLKLKAQNINFRYTIVGGNGDEELLFLINDLGLNENVVLTDQMPQEDVFKTMRSSNLFLLPSLEEGIANVAVEAMALGIPVISTNCGGMEELIGHNKEGWIVPVYDIDAISNQLIAFMDLPHEDVCNVSTSARAKVEQQHNEEKMVADMLQLYKKVTNTASKK